MGDQRLLALDIDGTLLDGDEPTAGLETLRLLLESRRERVRLVYATGRSFPSTRELVETGVLPAPDAVAAFVGTELWRPPWERPDPGFVAMIERDWDRRAVVEAVAGFEELVPQPDEVQTPWKASFYLDDEGLVGQVETALARRGLRATVRYSGGRFLDLLPAGAGKHAAVEYLRVAWEIARHHVLVGGDSGNDLDMLEDPRLRGVAVGNAQEELGELSEQQRVHQAELPFAAGVLEGAEAHEFWEETSPGRDDPD